MKSITINDFSGGMNDWLHPGLLPNNTAAELVNAEISSGKIVPVRRPAKLKISDPEEYGHYGNRDRSVVKWYDRYYWSNNTAFTPPYYGGNEENYLGIPYPAYSGENANVEITPVAAGEGETGLTGNYKYCVCFVNINGWEGAPGSLEEYEVNLELDNQFAEIKVSWDNPIVEYAKVYRTIHNGAEFYCVGEIRSSGGSLIDKNSDTVATMLNPLTSIDNYPPPDGGKFLCEYSGVFFLACGSLLYFSIQGNPHGWPTLNFISFDDTITGIVPEFQGVLVFTRNNVFRVIGADDPATVTKNYIPGNHGCVNFRTIAVLNNAPLWLSNDGICLWDGSNVTIPSYRVLKTDLLPVKYAVAANDKYYLFLTAGGIVFDRKNGDVFYKINFSCDYAWYDGNIDVVYLQIGNELFQYGTGNELTFSYVSPNIGGNELATKIYHELLVRSAGSGTATIYVDGEVQANCSIINGTSRIKLPFSAIGSALSVKITGAGGLIEIGVIYE